MLPAAARMRRRAEFTATLRGGGRAGAPALVLHVRPSLAGEGAPRIGFIVSRSVGGAVVRNQVRRRLRELCRERLDRFPAGAGVVIRANPAAAVVPTAQLGAQLDAALASALRRAEGVT